MLERLRRSQVFQLNFLVGINICDTAVKKLDAKGQAPTK